MRHLSLSFLFVAAACVPAVEYTPQEIALNQECQSCGPCSFAEDLRISSPRLIRSVEPISVLIDSSLPQYRLRGAKLRLVSLPGVTPEWVVQTLRCHGARQFLGRSAPVVDDPYWLPEGPVQIDVVSDGEGLAVAVTSDSVDQANGILARARRFASAAR